MNLRVGPGVCTGMPTGVGASRGRREPCLDMRQDSVSHALVAWQESTRRTRETWHVLIVPLALTRMKLGEPASQTADVMLASSEAHMVVVRVLQALTRME